MGKNALYVQSGGPTAVINASACGVIEACAQESAPIGRLFCAEYGVAGLLRGRLFDVSVEDPRQIRRLLHTPAAAFGSCRYRVPAMEEDDWDLRRILDLLEAYGIGYIFMNGGNGTVRACFDLNRFLQAHSYPCRILVIPKTVDNDVLYTDHTPGFPSAARHAVITAMELMQDIRVYDTGLIVAAEVMGRNSGWLAASTAAAGPHAPDLIYIPERVFDPQEFLRDVERVYREKGTCFAVVSEGVRTPEGVYLFDLAPPGKRVDAKQMGGITPYLHGLLSDHFSCKVRTVDFGLMQRCAAHNASPVDVQEAYDLGRAAVHRALAGESGKMLALRRVSNDPYHCEITCVPLESASRGDLAMPEQYTAGPNGTISPTYLEYLLPLVGELPQYANLRKQFARPAN